MAFNHSIVTLPKVTIAGIHVSTDITNASKECPALWLNFGEHVVGKLIGSPILDSNYNDNVYGASIALSESRFEYWAGCAITSTDGLPTELDYLILEAGDYVTCTVEQIEQIVPAYDSIYKKWSAETTKYELDLQFPCFEQYVKDWSPGMPFNIYVKIKAKL